MKSSVVHPVAKKRPDFCLLVYICGGQANHWWPIKSREEFIYLLLKGSCNVSLKEFGTGDPGTMAIIGRGDENGTRMIGIW